MVKKLDHLATHREVLMFVVRIRLHLRAEERAAFHELASEEGARARSLAGCVDYSFSEDVTDPSRAILYEEWRSRELFEAYKASAVFSATGARLRPLLAEPPQSAYYESDDLFASCAVA